MRITGKKPKSTTKKEREPVACFTVTCFTVAGKRGRTLKNRCKKTTLKFFTSQLVTRNSQAPPPRSKKLAVDFGKHQRLKISLICYKLILEIFFVITTRRQK
jgi:hypothetical protein